MIHVFMAYNLILTFITFQKSVLVTSYINLMSKQNIIRFTNRYLNSAPKGLMRPNRDGMGKPKGYLNPKARYVLEHHNLSGLPKLSKDYIVLGIESSCDDTGVAVVNSNGTILSNIVYSQVY